MSYVIPPPTKKQIEYINAIEKALGYKFDYENSNRKQASAYITLHVKEWKEYSKRNS